MLHNHGTEQSGHRVVAPGEEVISLEAHLRGYFRDGQYSASHATRLHLVLHLNHLDRLRQRPDVVVGKAKGLYLRQLGILREGW